jgi:hypothetical protein
MIEKLLTEGIIHTDNEELLDELTKLKEWRDETK